MAEPTFDLEILTPDGCLYSGKCTALTVRLDDGEATILAHHAPLLAMLPPGPVRVRLDREVRLFTCGEAFLKVSPQGTALFAQEGK